MSAVATAERPTAAVELPPLNEPRKRVTRLVLPVYSILMILYLTSPVFLMILYGFNDIPGERQTPRFWGFTLDWYKNLFNIPDLSRSLVHSISIAIPSAIAARTAASVFSGAITPIGPPAPRRPPRRRER